MTEWGRHHPEGGSPKDLGYSNSHPCLYLRHVERKRNISEFLRFTQDMLSEGSDQYVTLRVTRFFASLRMTRTQILRLKPQNDGVGKASS